MILSELQQLLVGEKTVSVSDLWKWWNFRQLSSVQFSSVTQSCPTLCDPMNHSTPGLPVHHQLPEFTQTHAHWVSDAIQPSHPLSSPSPPAPNPSQHQGLFQWVNSSHEVAKVLEFQLQHQSFQWPFLNMSKAAHYFPAESSQMFYDSEGSEAISLLRIAITQKNSY